MRRPERAAEGVGLEDLAQVDRLADLVRDLDADVALAADAVDADRLGLEGEGEVVGEADDLRVLDAGVGLELVGGDDRPGVDLLDRPHHAELAALRLEDAALLEQAVVVDRDAALGLVEDRDRGQDVVPPHLAAGRGGLAARPAAGGLPTSGRGPRPSSSSVVLRPGAAKGSAFWAGAATRAGAACSGRSSGRPRLVGRPRRPGSPVAFTFRMRGSPPSPSLPAVCLRMTSRRIFSLRRLSR